jgi:hypothetical protein
MSVEQDKSQRRTHLVEMVVGLGNQAALKWLEENVWIEAEDEYDEDLPSLVRDEIDILTDEQVEQCIAELEG